MGEFLFMNNGPMRGEISSSPSCCINNYITPLMLIPHTIKYCFRYGIYYVLVIWYDMGWYFWILFLCWYCWLVFLWMSWRWFILFWCCNLLPKFWLKIGSIIEWDTIQSISSIYRFSYTYSIVGVDVVDIWWFFGRR